jgi:Protein of unknown function (DUF3551)
MREVLFGSACAVVFAITLIPARAEVNYPYCAMTPGGYGTASGSCGFVSLEQCRQTVQGSGGWCQANPVYSVGSAPTADAPRRARARANPRW